MSAHQPVRFTTDSGAPIGLGSASTMGNGRSQTSVGGSRVKANRANLNSLQSYLNPQGSSIDPLVFASNTLPQNPQGMSIQNNIQNLNFNINLTKGSYGSAQFLP